MTEPMAPRLSLETPQRLRTHPHGSLLVPLLLVLIALMQAAGLLLWWRGPSDHGGATSHPGRAREFFDLALALEQKSLPREAARAFEQFLALSQEDKDRPQHFYHAGSLRMDAGDFDLAAAHFIAAEIAVKGGSAALPRELGTRLIDCLRRLGLHGEVGRELARRVDAGGAPDSSKVVATYGDESITEADLDRWIERRVDQMLGPSVAVDAQDRQSLLEQWSSKERRAEVLSEILRTDLFARRARELLLDQKPELKDMVRDSEQGLLALMLEREELSSRRPTESDVEAYFAAHRGDYRTPRSADILLLELEPDESLPDLKSRIVDAQAFVKEAEQRGPPQRIHLVEGGADPKWQPFANLFWSMQPGDFTHEPLPVGEQRFLALVESSQESREPAYEEVNEQVIRDYSEVKRAEILSQLAGDLMKRYDVKLLDSASAGATSR